MTKPIPPDRERCQAEIKEGSFMTLGPRNFQRCKEVPTVIATERAVNEEYGHKGSMSLCDACLKVFQLKMGAFYADIEPIKKEETYEEYEERMHHAGTTFEELQRWYYELKAENAKLEADREEQNKIDLKQRMHIAELDEELHETELLDQQLDDLINYIGEMRAKKKEKTHGRTGEDSGA